MQSAARNNDFVKPIRQYINSAYNIVVYIILHVRVTIIVCSVDWPKCLPGSSIWSSNLVKGSWLQYWINICVTDGKLCLRRSMLKILIGIKKYVCIIQECLRLGMD